MNNQPPVTLFVDSSNIVPFANVVTNTVNVLTRLGFQPEQESKGHSELSNKKLSLELKQHWVQRLEDHRLKVSSLIAFKYWLEPRKTPNFNAEKKTKKGTFASTAEDSTQPKNSECPLKDRQHAIWSCEKFKSMQLIERWEHVQKFRLCFNCLRPCHPLRHCKTRNRSVLNYGRRHNRRLHTDFSKRETTTEASDAMKAVATIIPQGGLPVVCIGLQNWSHNLSLLAVCDTGS